MEKILETRISNCKQCPWLKIEGMESICTKADKCFKTRDTGSLPDWCPLSTYTAGDGPISHIGGINEFGGPTSIGDSIINED